MNPELQDAIKLFIDKFNTGGDFILAEAPNVLREMVVYGRISNIIWFPIIGILVYLTYRLWPPTKESWRDASWESEIPCVFLTITSVVLSGLSAILLGVALDIAVKVWFTPALYVFDCVMEKLP